MNPTQLILSGIELNSIQYQSIWAEDNSGFAIAISPVSSPYLLSRFLTNFQPNAVGIRGRIRVSGASGNVFNYSIWNTGTSNWVNVTSLTATANAYESKENSFTTSLNNYIDLSGSLYTLLDYSFSGVFNTSYINVSLQGAAAPNGEAAGLGASVIPSSMTKAQRNAISNPSNGLIIYQTDGTPGNRAYENGAWVSYVSLADP